MMNDPIYLTKQLYNIDGGGTQRFKVHQPSTVHILFGAQFKQQFKRENEREENYKIIKEV